MPPQFRGLEGIRKQPAPAKAWPGQAHRIQRLLGRNLAPFGAFAAFLSAFLARCLSRLVALRSACQTHLGTSSPQRSFQLGPVQAGARETEVVASHADLGTFRVVLHALLGAIHAGFGALLARHAASRLLGCNATANKGKRSHQSKQRSNPNTAFHSKPRKINERNPTLLARYDAISSASGKAFADSRSARGYPAPATARPPRRFLERQVGAGVADCRASPQSLPLASRAACSTRTAAARPVLAAVVVHSRNDSK